MRCLDMPGEALGPLLLEWRETWRAASARTGSIATPGFSCTSVRSQKFVSAGQRARILHHHGHEDIGHRAGLGAGETRSGQRRRSRYSIVAHAKRAAHDRFGSRPKRRVQ